MTQICTRCGTPEPLLRARERDLWVAVCRDCVAERETVVIDLPAGDVVGEVAPEVNQ